MELGKFAASQARAGDLEVPTELERWLRFFTEGERLDADALPAWMQTEEMQQAMSTLSGFSEKEREYHAYQARQNYLRQQRSIQRRLDELEGADERARVAEERVRAVEERRFAEEEAALQREAAASAEIERLKRLLAEMGGSS